MSRILHISDLHFWHIPRNPSLWFSKRATAYLALLMQSSRRFKEARMHQLLKAIETLQLTHIVISGDLTLSGSESEFHMFNEFYQELKKHAPHVCLVPGNHDLYIERTWNMGFYKHGSAWMKEETLKSLFENRQATELLGDVEFILLDQALPRPIGHAEGIFTDTQALQLKETLSQPMNAKFRVVVGHYPMHPTKKTSTELDGFGKLEASLRDQGNVSAYLHGHTHQQHLIDERYFGLPVSIDSGCLSDPQQAAFCVLDLQENLNHTYLYRHDPLHGWQMHQELLWNLETREIATETLML